VNLLNPPRLDKSAVRKSFNRCAGQYDDSAVLQREVLSRLLERLDYIKLEPKLILDLGCGTGQAIKPLKKRYGKARVLALDMAEAMLEQSRKQYGLFDKKWLVNADMEHLPLKDQCVDMVFSSLALQWSNDLQHSFAEFKRVGRPGGLLMFTTFGVNTLSELRQSFALIDDTPRVHQFMDMHDVGDMMLGAGLSQPVMDMEQITLQYKNFRDLLSDLKSIGATNAEKGRQRGLMTAGKLKRLQQAYEEIAFEDGCYQASYEIVYGHAWF
jgi:malonyl-CoA O-methyltransferase